jgi:hypothetical protein
MMQMHAEDGSRAWLTYCKVGHNSVISSGENMTIKPAFNKIPNTKGSEHFSVSA